MYKYLIFLALTGCASLEKYNTYRPSAYSAQVQKELYAQIEKTMAETEIKLKDHLIGEIYINSSPLCDAVTVNTYELFLKSYDEKKKDNLDGGYGLRVREPEKKAYVFKPLSKVSVKSIKVLIHPRDFTSKFSEVEKKYVHQWSGSSEVYFMANQDGVDFIVKEYSHEFSKLIKNKNMFFDSKNSGLNSFECFSKANPVSTFKLTKKDIKSIGEGGWYMGMGVNSLILSLGHPQKVNSTTNKYSSTSQWVYPNAYIYFRGGVISSWQN